MTPLNHDGLGKDSIQSSDAFAVIGNSSFHSNPAFRRIENWVIGGCLHDRPRADATIATVRRAEPKLATRQDIFGEHGSVDGANKS